MSTTSRRDILKQGGILSLGLLGASVARAAESCGLTPAQTEGPFYPVADQADKDTDLTKVAGHAETAKGQRVRIVGTVKTADCTPIAGAMVEIWQACHTGKYNHPEDPNEAELDEHFQYWGRTTTDANGNYSFVTIKPGAYQATADWVRPPHIHYKIAAPGYRSLTTQLYFDGDPLNAKDRILRSLPAAVRSLVISKFTPQATDPNTIEGRFDVALGRLGAPGVTPELD
jgi:protocatechuate 3,4-dioxygenase beta subunit